MYVGAIKKLGITSGNSLIVVKGSESNLVIKVWISVRLLFNFSIKYNGELRSFSLSG